MLLISLLRFHQSRRCRKLSSIFFSFIFSPFPLHFDHPPNIVSFLSLFFPLTSGTSPQSHIFRGPTHGNPLYAQLFRLNPNQLSQFDPTAQWQTLSWSAQTHFGPYTTHYLQNRTLLFLTIPQLFKITTKFQPLTNS